jgi:transcriptional regulator with XRE-family HTH domain
MEVCEMLKEILEKEQRLKGVSIRDLAKQANVSHTTIYRALRGETIDLDTVLDLAKWLGVRPSTLVNSLDRSDDSVPAKVALVIEHNPELKVAFEQAVKNVELDSVDPVIIEDIAAYAAYKIGLARKDK